MVRLPRKPSTKLNMTFQAKTVRQSLLPVLTRYLEDFGCLVCFSSFFHLQVCRGETLPMMLGNFDKKTCASFFLVVIPFWRNVGRFFVEQNFSPKRNFRVYHNPSPVSIGEQCSKLQNLGYLHILLVG